MSSNVKNDVEKSSIKQGVKKKVSSDLKFPLPSKDIGFDKNFEMISAYVIGSAYGKNPVGYKELEPYVSFSAIAISGSNKFFEHIGLIQNSEGTQRFVPTKLAIDLNNSIQLKNESEIKSILRQAISNSWFCVHAKQLLEIQKLMKKNMLIEKLGKICMANPKTHARSLATLVEFLKYSELVISNDAGEFSLNPAIIEKLTTKIDIDQSKDLLQVSIGNEIYAMDVDKLKDFVLSNGKKISNIVQRLE